MRGFFGIGVEGVTKPMNLGNLIRSAHAFGASFVFLIETPYSAAPSDTADTPHEVPIYAYDSPAGLILPAGCKLVGVEMTDDAAELPSFRHPRAAAYVLGPERDGLSPAMLERCDLVVKIPTRFSINVATAGAIVMYDRVLNLGRFPARPLFPGGPVEPLDEPVHGPVRLRRQHAPDTDDAD